MFTSSCSAGGWITAEVIALVVFAVHREPLARAVFTIGPIRGEVRLVHTRPVAAPHIVLCVTASRAHLGLLWRASFAVRLIGGEVVVGRVGSGAPLRSTGDVSRGAAARTSCVPYIAEVTLRAVLIVVIVGRNSY